MYDATNEPKEFVAEAREQAIAKACEFFGVPAEELRVTEFQPGEIYGLSNRVAVVAVPRNRRPTQRGSERGSERARGRGPSRRGEPRERGERSEGGRGRSREREAPRDRGAQPEISEPSVGTAVGEVGDIGSFVLGVIERMQLGAFEIREASEEDLIVVQVGGAAAPRLAGADGRVVDALQLLANQAAGRLNDEPPRVVLDVEGDAEARESRLDKLARRVAKRALDSGRSVRLDPMNGRDRRVIHVALRDEPAVVTISTGEGRYRQVVVVPEGAPEFEEAKRESEEAAERDAS